MVSYLPKIILPNNDQAKVDYAALDRALRRRLNDCSAGDEDYWSFRRDADRENAHSYLHYPAMMVPKMQRALIGAIDQIYPITGLLDPYMGSGTALTEAMIRGIDFTGCDINPLAVLICKAKSGPFLPKELAASINLLNGDIARDSSTVIEADFAYLDKWFGRDMQLQLSRIRRSIRRRKYKWMRRFYWVALAETVRLVSNSRTSTYKLHTRTQEEITARSLDAVATFHAIVRANYVQYCSLTEILQRSGYLLNGDYVGAVNIYCRDSRRLNQTGTNAPTSNLLLTSPSYGDNETTVPYGQYSYLPLQWIDLADIGHDVDESFLATTHEIDHRSLGGSKRITSTTVTDLCDKSTSLRRFLHKIRQQPRDRTNRVVAFCRDLDASIDPIMSMLSSNGIMAWTVGNRKVGGHRLPIDCILVELLKDRKAKEVKRLSRTIPSKRMPVKNKISETMSTETVLVLRKDEIP